MTPELLKTVVDGRLNFCLSDVKSLVSSVGSKLQRIAREIDSGDKSRVEIAPENIQSLVDELRKGFKECAKKHCGEEESAVEVEFHDLMLDVLTLPLAGTPEVQIEGGGKITTYKGSVLAALYEVMANICKSGATQIKLTLLPGEDKMIILVVGNEPGFSDVGLALACRLIESVGGSIAVHCLNGVEIVSALIVIPDL